MTPNPFVEIKDDTPCSCEATPVEIQELIGNLCPNASSINHGARCGGDTWYNGKSLLAVFWQKQNVQCNKPVLHSRYKNSFDFVILYLDLPSEVLELLVCSDLFPDRLVRLLSYLSRGEMKNWWAWINLINKDMQVMHMRLGHILTIWLY